MNAKEWSPPKPKRKKRKCSYCRETGHDRRTCDTLVLHCAKFARLNSTFLHLVQDDLKDRGIGPGSLVEYIQMVDGKRKTTAIAVITRLNWDMLFFRRPGKRWINARVLESSAVIKGSYGFAPPDKWHLRLPYHELNKEWCGERQKFLYRKELKDIPNAEDSEISGAYGMSGGFWRLASAVRVSYSHLIKNRPIDFMRGWYGVRDHFSDLTMQGGIRECKAID